MKVVHISYDIHQSSANLRIQKAIKLKGVESNILVMKETDVTEGITLVSEPNYITKAFNVLRNKKQEYVMSKYTIPNPGMMFSLQYCGLDISGEKCVQEADIIHLHWICAGYLRPEDIAKLLKLNKPIVWTMHDCWPLTGGCHHGCDKYTAECGECPVLGSDIKKDASYKLLKKKINLWSNKGIVTVSPSTWLQKRANNSSIFKNGRNECIPNPLDIDRYKMKDTKECDRDKFKVLFGAVDPTSPYKGFKYLEEALELLTLKYPLIADKIQLIIYGTDHLDSKVISCYDHVFTGYINGDEGMSNLFRNGNLTVVPSIYEMLGDVVMESLASGTPVLAFETGGIPDMVDHKRNGYLAKRMDSEDLCEGLVWIYNNNPNNILGAAGRKKVEKDFSMNVVGQKYLDLYNGLL